MIAAEPVVAAKKLKIKFVNRNHNSQGVSDKQNAAEVGGSKCGSSEMGNDLQVQKKRKMDEGEINQSIKHPCSESVIDCQPSKKRKMERSIVHQCSCLLRTLTNHPSCGWMFKEPVDPEKLCIPDYFTIITNPMDLGTIKTKLDQNQYFGTDEFAADVRLTFANAMLYNPPMNFVHKGAVKLSKIFETKWKALNQKWNNSIVKTAVGEASSLRPIEIETSSLKRKGPENLPLDNLIMHKRLKPSEDKVPRSTLNVRPAEAEVFKVEENCNRKLMQHDGGKHAFGSVSVKPSSGTAVSKSGSCGRSDYQCIPPSDSAQASSDISSEIETSSLKRKGPENPPLHNVITHNRLKPSEDKVPRSTSNVRLAEAKVSKVEENCNCKSMQNDGGKHAFGSANVKPSSGPAVSKSGSCGRSGYQYIPPSDSAHASSDISSERSSGRDHHVRSSDTSKPKKCMSTSQISKSDPDSDGAVSALDEENTCPSSQLMTSPTDANSEEGWKPPIYGVQLSPKKALRAAMLKHRFADTILKAQAAQHKTLLDHGDNADPVKLLQEKERLAKRQREEKAAIEAQIKAAEAAAKEKEEEELKRQREKEREASRVALQQMEKTAEALPNSVFVEELEKLSGFSLAYSYSFGRRGSVVSGESMDGSECWSPLEQLGLFMKDDEDMVDDEILFNNGDEEEGEICS